MSVKEIKRQCNYDVAIKEAKPVKKDNWYKDYCKSYKEMVKQPNNVKIPLEKSE